MQQNEGVDSILAPIRPILFNSPLQEAVPAQERVIPVEHPIAIRYSGVSHGVMMASPGDLIDFAYGFSLSEGVIDHARQIRTVQIVKVDSGILLDIELSGETLRQHLHRRRAFVGRTGCGVCGVESLGDLPQAKPLQSSFAPIPDMTALRAGLSGLEKEQSLNHLTQAVHAAAWCDAEGKVIALREDVGRHNALDKLIGAILRQKISVFGGFAVITSRCSFEMVEKAVRSEMPVLVAVSAPTSLAVERAKILGLTLLAIARSDGALLFAGPNEEDTLL